MDDKKCSFIKPDGNRCSAFHMKDSNYCFTHNPEVAQERALAHRKAGLAQKFELGEGVEVVWAKNIRLKRPRDIVRFTSKIMNELRQGKVEPRIATALFYGANVLIRAFEVSEITERVENIERVLESEKAN